MRESNTGHKNITYDAARDRYRCEMRVGKMSRAARCKSPADALEIRDELAKERGELETRGNTARKSSSGAFRIERREVVINFDRAKKGKTQVCAFFPYLAQSK